MTRYRYTVTWELVGYFEDDEMDEDDREDYAIEDSLVNHRDKTVIDVEVSEFNRV